ncbi:MAG TPA: ferrous iron transporter B [Clostridiales bacterium]|nr:ferrous iron transporter B [Clostridiales bacterium]
MEGQLLNFRYNDKLEQAIRKMEDLLKSAYNISKREIALLLLQEDEEILDRVGRQEGERLEKIYQVIQETKQSFEQPLNYIIAMERQEWANRVTDKVVVQNTAGSSRFGEILNKLTIQPLTGIPILLLVLYFGLYKFVGVLGAGEVVDFLEGELFEGYINPWVNNLVTAYIPWKPIQELIGLDYGIITMGLRYAVAIILPIVGFFFLIFSVIEDSGYLPRLALLIDRLFKKIGLSGRAVIPMTLGFGCGTMATMVSRTLETKRERIIATFLLALTIPCSAQLGVIMSLLSGYPAAMLIWIILMLLVFLLIGYLTAKVVPGDQTNFYMEVPPLRIPKLSNVLAKTFSRMQWYFVEILPLFLLGSVIIWVGNMTGLFQKLLLLVQPILVWMDLPPETAESFVFGFFRRDYGAAGLYDLQSAGLLSPRQLVVAAATLTLFVPCVAQFTMMIKERGWKMALGMVAIIFPFAFIVGILLNALLNMLGVLA